MGQVKTMRNCRLTKVDNGYLVEISDPRDICRKQFVAKTLDTVLDIVRQWDDMPVEMRPDDANESCDMEETGE